MKITSNTTTRNTNISRRTSIRIALPLGKAV
jgi:hypothetical protein